MCQLLNNKSVPSAYHAKSKPMSIGTGYLPRVNHIETGNTPTARKLSFSDAQSKSPFMNSEQSDPPARINCTNSGLQSNMSRSAENRRKRNSQDATAVSDSTGSASVHEAT